MSAPDLERVEITALAELHEWLRRNHRRSDGVWLVTWKKTAPDKYVGRLDVLDELICFGWIDGRRMALDENRTMQLITPRQTQAWAQSYKDRAAALITAGRMQPPGQAAIEAGKASGLWDYWADVDALIIPDDLGVALTAGGVCAQFEVLAPSYRRNLLRWLKLAKTAATRQKRIAQIVQSTQAGKKIPQM